jgi:hypothetical protein
MCCEFNGFSCPGMFMSSAFRRIYFLNNDTYTFLLNEINLLSFLNSQIWLHSESSEYIIFTVG